jgi:hypothetical protein
MKQTLSELMEMDERYSANPETRFAEFKEEFAKYDDLTRQSVLAHWETLLDNQPMRPTPETAMLVQRFREIRGIHRMLQKVSR